MELVDRYLLRYYDPTPSLKPRPKSVIKGRPHPYIHLYNTKTWVRLRALVLGREPLCRTCGTLAKDVDHIIPHRGDRKLFHDFSNLQPLCRRCHNTKTRMERRNG